MLKYHAGRQKVCCQMSAAQPSQVTSSTCKRKSVKSIFEAEAVSVDSDLTVVPAADVGVDVDAIDGTKASRTRGSQCFGPAP
jgi:hypothetical protein